MHARSAVVRLAVYGEIRRAGKLLQGDPDAYSDLIEHLDYVFSQLDEFERDEGSPLPEEEYDA